METPSNDNMLDQQNVENRMAALTRDEREGLSWWNALTEERRAYWLREAGTNIAADAWAEYKRRWQFRR